MRGKEHRLVLGKVDYHNRGRRINEVAVTWELTDGRFSMSAEVWNGNHTGVTACGQMVDEVAVLFPHNTKLQRMRAIWERYHLNDMHAGSAVQMTYLREHPLDPASYVYPNSHYDVASKVLADAGLNPDPEGYRYGSAWKREELPPEVIAEIESWG